MWFSPSSDTPDHASFRDAMSQAMEAARGDAVSGDGFQVALHEGWSPRSTCSWLETERSSQPLTERYRDFWRSRWVRVLQLSW